MTNSQVRLIAVSIFVLAGGLASSSSSLDANVGLGMIIIGVVVFIVEYLRSQKD